MLGFRDAAAKTSSLISFGTAFGILRKRLVVSAASVRRVVKPGQDRPHTDSTELKKGTLADTLLNLAERVGFEPTVA